jgi:AcrR family transcriptional regulator
VDVREKILVESGQLFGRYGIRSMTMDTLAEEMGISKRTIYERFKDKDTLLREVFEYFKKVRTDEAMQIIDRSDNVIEALFRMVESTISQVERMNPNFFHDLKKYHTRVFREMEGSHDIRDFTITEKLLSLGIEQRVFRSDIHVDIVSRAMHELYQLFGHESSLVEAGFHRKDMFNHIVIPYLRGISTKKGNDLIEQYKDRFE